MLKKNDLVPDLDLEDHTGQLVSLRSYIGEKPLVVYFYPKNNTPGCTAEACAFRDNYQDFTDLGAEVIGISGDSISSHENVRKKRKLPFILLSDRKRKAEKAFGVPRNLFGMLPGRVTFVIDKEGSIVHTFTSASNPTKHVDEALRHIKKLV